jgi:hypothetical protein
MLIVVSGPDRVGKSTLIKQMSDTVGGKAFVAHHSAPPNNQLNIFDFYKADIRRWKQNQHNQPIAIFDRAWPCSYILEQHRRRNAGHFEDVIDFEMWLNDEVGAVCHLAQFRPWHWSAGLHIEEIREENPKAATWFIRDELIARMQEHQIYTEQLQTFYENVTMFPNVQLTSTVPATAAIELCRNALTKAGT